ncbi:unnamed protein product, partial [Trichogramma brassicae]
MPGLPLIHRECGARVLSLPEVQRKKRETTLPALRGHDAGKHNQAHARERAELARDDVGGGMLRDRQIVLCGCSADKSGGIESGRLDELEELDFKSVTRRFYVYVKLQTAVSSVLKDLKSFYIYQIKGIVCGKYGGVYMEIRKTSNNFYSESQSDLCYSRGPGREHVAWVLVTLGKSAALLRKVQEVCSAQELTSECAQRPGAPSYIARRGRRATAAAAAVVGSRCLSRGREVAPIPVRPKRRRSAELGVTYKDRKSKNQNIHLNTIEIYSDRSVIQ